MLRRRIEACNPDPCPTDDKKETATVRKITIGPLVIQRVTCMGLEVNAIIDTGASLSVFSPALLKRFNPEGATNNGPTLIMASGQQMKPEKKCEICITHPYGATAKATVAVLELKLETTCFWATTSSASSTR